MEKNPIIAAISSFGKTVAAVPKKLKNKLKRKILRNRWFWVIAIIVPLEILGPTLGATIRYIGIDKELHPWAAKVNLGAALLGSICFIVAVMLVNSYLKKRVKPNQ